MQLDLKEKWQLSLSIKTTINTISLKTIFKNAVCVAKSTSSLGIMSGILSDKSFTISRFNNFGDIFGVEIKFEHFGHSYVWHSS
jgi:hypothetical protein